MNIFYTNHNPQFCAREHCTVHTRKMIIEYAQMLSTAHRVCDGDEFADEDSLYKRTHENHPCTKWVRANSGNYRWLYACLKELCKIYWKSSGNKHATHRLLEYLQYCPVYIPNYLCTWEPPPQAMPDEFKHKDIREAYKQYINSKYLDWLSREKPIKVDWYFEKPEWAEYGG